MISGSDSNYDCAEGDLIRVSTTVLCHGCGVSRCIWSQPLDWHPPLPDRDCWLYWTGNPHQQSTSRPHTGHLCMYQSEHKATFDITRPSSRCIGVCSEDVIHSSVYLFVYSLIVRSFLHLWLFICSFNCFFVHSFLHSFMLIRRIVINKWGIDWLNLKPSDKPANQHWSHYNWRVYSLPP